MPALTEAAPPSNLHRPPHRPASGGRGPHTLASTLIVAAFITLAPTAGVSAPAPGTGGSPDDEHSRPYDAKLLRLAELLGSIHYLRELCGANEGQFWRDTMQELMKSESASAIRRARLTSSFNQGYRSYSRTYNVCTPTARATINRFLAEGAELAEGLVHTSP